VKGNGVDIPAVGGIIYFMGLNKSRPFRLADHLRDGDTILIGQAVAEPAELVRELVDVAGDRHGMTALCGYTLSDGWHALVPGTLDVKGVVAHGGLRRLARTGLFDPLPWHLSAFQRNIEEGLLRPDVVMIQTGPADDEGFYNLGATVDYVMSAVNEVRVVLLEVNRRMPRTRSAYRLHRSQVTATIESQAELATSPARPATPTEHNVAQRVARLVPSGACIQLGLGSLADEVGRQLLGHKDLRVRSGVAGDWLADLHAAGALAEAEPAARVSMALGSRRLYDFLDDSTAVEFAPTGDLVAPVAVRRDGPLFAVNSAIEVDLSGQVNAETVAGRYVGGIGGQVDFLRATRACPGSLALIAISSTHPDGSSRIVINLSGPVTSLRSDVDVVVTEHGVADLRAGSIAERAERLAAIAAPEHREALTDAVRATRLNQLA
jgi:acyl-CoA hydrolase